MSYVIDEFCYLGTVNKSIQNARGTIIPAVTFDNVKTWCTPKSIRMSEAYQALSVGMKPELTLEIRQEDYSGQTRVKYGGIVYRILRTYRTGRSKIELVLYREEHPDAS